MKKLRFVVPTLVLAVAMMGSGYAAWTDSLTVNNNVVTGSFDFQISAPPAPTININTGAGFQADFLTARTVSGTGKSVNVDFENISPAVSTIVFDVPVTNNSTVSSEFKGFDLSSAMPAGLTCKVVEKSSNIDLSGKTKLDIPKNTNFTLEYTIDTANMTQPAAPITLVTPITLSASMTPNAVTAITAN